MGRAKQPRKTTKNAAFSALDHAATLDDAITYTQTALAQGQQKANKLIGRRGIKLSPLILNDGFRQFLTEQFSDFGALPLLARQLIPEIDTDDPKAFFDQLAAYVWLNHKIDCNQFRQLSGAEMVYILKHDLAAHDKADRQRQPAEIDDEANWTHVEFAQHYKIPSETARQRLNRWRKSHPSESGRSYHVNADRRGRKSSYVYLVGKVKHLF
jgi:hypothetical protein